VEDYIVELLNGGSSPTATVDLQSSQATVLLSGGDLVVSENGTDLFAAPTDSLGPLQVQALDSDSVVTLALPSDPAGGVVIDGGDGNNTLDLKSGSVDLTSGMIDASNFQTLDLTDESDTALTINAAIVANLSPNNSTISISGIDGDTVTFADLDDWRVESGIIRDGVFFRVAVNQMTSEIVELDLPAPWQNPLEASDVDASGEVTAGDALRIINELARRAFSDGNSQAMNDPLTVETWPNVYFDQNGDGNATALDALRVINRLALVDSEGEQIDALWAWFVGSEQTQADTNPATDLQTDARGNASAAAKIVDTSNSMNGGGETDSSTTTSNDGDQDSWQSRVDDLLSSESEIELWS
jgi:hypothetical protein